MEDVICYGIFKFCDLTPIKENEERIEVRKEDATKTFGNLDAPRVSC
jgi:hypothetical protein